MPDTPCLCALRPYPATCPQHGPWHPADAPPAAHAAPDGASWVQCKTEENDDAEI